MISIASVDQTLLPSLLLELRTKEGPVYVCPSGFDRMRLRWTFRHFRTLPSQLLSRRDQRLIERLCETAVVTPSRPVPSDAILGVVDQTVVRRLAAAPATLRSGWPSRWAYLGTVSAAVIGMTVLIASTRVAVHQAQSLPVVHATTQSQPAPVQPPVMTLPEAIVPPSVPIIAQPRPPAAEKPQAVAAVITPPPAADPVPAAVAEPVVAERRWVTELPQGHFVRPVIGQRSPTGEVQLNALIAPDGSVQQVTPVSGNRELAEAGMRAVRQWHYNPYSVPETSVEEETRIKMNFFGPDAVSIGSVTVQP